MLIICLKSKGVAQQGIAFSSYSLAAQDPTKKCICVQVRPQAEVIEYDIAPCRGHSILSRAHSHRGPEGPAALLLCPAADPGAAPASCRSRGNCCSAHWLNRQRQPGRRRSASEEGASTSAACSAGQARHTGKNACGVNMCSAEVSGACRRSRPQS